MSDESDDALNLMTIHKAKGLEFECGTIKPTKVIKPIKLIDEIDLFY